MSENAGKVVGTRQQQREPCVRPQQTAAGAAGMSATSLLEVSSTTAAGTTTSTGAGAGAGTGAGAGAGAEAGAGGSLLNCHCEEYNCHCLKECFCRFTGDPFNGVQYPPEANCPVCKYCGPRPAAPGDKKVPGKPDKKIKDHDFKVREETI